MQPISIPQIQCYLTNLQQLTLQKGKIQQEKCALFFAKTSAILAKNIKNDIDTIIDRDKIITVYNSVTLKNKHPWVENFHSFIYLLAFTILDYFLP